MSVRGPSVCKITISLPKELVQFTELEAVRLGLNRSQVISKALTQAKLMEEKRLAAEGYQFYSQESVEFAAASSNAVKEVLENGS
jgi:metal-responsive CopG/Arc/MetJ family transcriptional regulator